MNYSFAPFILQSGFWFHTCDLFDSNNGKKSHMPFTMCGVYE